jgi:hypothetical protein
MKTFNELLEDVYASQYKIKKTQVQDPETGEWKWHDHKVRVKRIEFKNSGMGGKPAQDTEQENNMNEATVKTQKYSWGTMKTIHHGADFSIPLHPEHHEAIAKLKDEQEHNFKDETGRSWTARRKGDDVHFQGANGGNSTVVKHSTMTEATIAGTPGWKKIKQNIKDKSGATHTPMSRARDLARKAIKTVREQTIAEEHVVHVNDGSKYGEQPHDKDAEHVMTGVKMHGGEFDGHSDKGAYFKFKSSTDAKNFKRHVDSCPHKSCDADLLEGFNLDEVLSKSAEAGDWIHDFIHSDNPKFAGKSKEKRKQMAIAAYYAKQRNEEVESIEELNKSTLGSYVKKASVDSTISRKIATDFEHRAKKARKQDMRDANTSVSNQFKDKSWKRQDNINKAVDRLTKEEVELQEANHRDFASVGKMHPDMAKHMEVGQHMDYYEPKTGDKVHGKVMHKSATEVHMKQTHDSYNPKKVGSVHKFKVSSKLEEGKMEDIVTNKQEDKLVGKSPAKNTDISDKSYLKDKPGIKSDLKNFGRFLAGKKETNEEVELDEATSPTAGTRLVKKYGSDEHRSEVRYNPEWQEYQVHHYKNGKHMGEGPVSYHGDDKQDVHDTAKSQAEKRNSMKEEIEIEEDSMISIRSPKLSYGDMAHHNMLGKVQIGRMEHGSVYVHSKKDGKKYRVSPNSLKMVSSMREEKEEDGYMAKIDLATIVNHIKRLEPMLDQNIELPDWVVSKITIAADYIGTVADYMEACQQVHEEKQYAGLEKEKKPGLPTAMIKKSAKAVEGDTVEGWDHPNKAVRKEEFEQIDEATITFDSEDEAKAMAHKLHHNNSSGHYDGNYHHGIKNRTGGKKYEIEHAYYSNHTVNKEIKRLQNMKEEVETRTLSYKDFMESITFTKTGLIHKGTRGYGNQPEEQEDDEDDNKKKKAVKTEPAVKRGRGRPAGAKSGANQKVSGGKTGNGADYTGYKLHLPNANKY